jgi:hypothetical protein
VAFGSIPAVHIPTFSDAETMLRGETGEPEKYSPLPSLRRSQRATVFTAEASTYTNDKYAEGVFVLRIAKQGRWVFAISLACWRRRRIALAAAKPCSRMTANLWWLKRKHLFSLGDGDPMPMYVPDGKGGTKGGNVLPLPPGCRPGPQIKRQN